MPNPVAWFEVVGKDVDALRSFYGELFGWTIQDAPGGIPYALVQTDPDQPPAGGIGPDPSGGGGHVTWYVGVDDLRATLDKAQSLG